MTVFFSAAEYAIASGSVRPEVAKATRYVEMPWSSTDD